MEIWKKIKGYNGRYEVSNTGKVRSNYGKGRLLKSGLGGNGYLTVALCLNGKPRTYTVHSLVAETFLDYEIQGYERVVDHIDNNKLNNDVNNLRIVTVAENLKGVVRGKNYSVR